MFSTDCIGICLFDKDNDDPVIYLFIHFQEEQQVIDGNDTKPVHKYTIAEAVYLGSNYI